MLGQQEVIVKSQIAIALLLIGDAVAIEFVMCNNADDFTVFFKKHFGIEPISNGQVLNVLREELKLRV